MNAPENWSRAENVLCIRLDALGDVLMTTPALRALKEARPGRKLTLLTSAGGSVGSELIPAVDEVIVYDAPWMKSTAPRAGSQADRAIVKHLSRAGFDAAVIFTVYSQNPLPAAMLCYMADIPLRLAHCRENPYQLLTDWVRDPEPEHLVRHEVRRQLDLVGSVGCRTADERMCLRVPEEARDRIREHLGRIGLNPGLPWVVIHPGASAPSRRYPPKQFARAARRLALDVGMQVVFTGGPEEVELVEGIRADMEVPSMSLAGQITLGELAALLELAPLLIANNTGPVHVAAAVGTAVVDLYALTNPQHTPWMVPHRVLNHDVPCKYCYRSICTEQHHACLRLVPPEQIVEAVWAVLAESGRARREGTHQPLLQASPPHRRGRIA
jgi:lipopolysaccharide heptosyltransferase II